jgi:hypothetical protein
MRAAKSCERKAQATKKNALLSEFLPLPKFVRVYSHKTSADSVTKRLKCSTAFLMEFHRVVLRRGA